MMVSIGPVNQKPTFQVPPKVVVLQDSGCLSSTIFWEGFSGAKCDRREPRRHVRSGFASRISVGNSYESGAADMCASESSACQSQQARFSVIAHNQTVTDFLFERGPDVSPNGTLSFILKEFRSGSANFTLKLEDDGQPPEVSIEHVFTIQVNDLNDAPTFEIPSRIVGFEDTPFEHIAVFDVSEGPFEGPDRPFAPFQHVTFNVTVQEPDLFVELPSITKQGSEGILRFVPQTDVFGNTLANVTISDDGGSDFGGISSSTKPIVIEIWPVNDLPVVNFVRDVFAFENAAPQALTGMIADSRTGPDNEEGICDSLPGDCQSQAFVFDFDFASNVDVFAMLPRIDASGLLTFQLCKGCNGVTSICFRAQDDGDSLLPANDPSCSDCRTGLQRGVNCCQAPRRDTDPHIAPQFCSTLHVEAVDTAPAFKLSWDVDYGRVGVSCFCTDAVTVSTREDFSQEQACQPRSPMNDLATVRALEDAPEQNILNFASGISTANGYVTSAEVLFNGDINDGELSFGGIRPDPVSSTPGLEMATDYCRTADNFFIVTEPENDGISMWTPAANGTLSFVDRRTSGEDRLRFRGFIDPSAKTTLHPMTAQVR